MVFVNLFRTTALALLCCGGAHSLLAAEPDSDPISLHDALGIGRTKSKLLNERRVKAKDSDVIPTANLKHFRKSIRPLLMAHCVDCHGPDKSEGQLRIDQLNPDLLTGTDVQRWREVYDALINSEMPPEDEPEFAITDADRSAIVDWIGDEMNKASLARRGQREGSSFRRLAKYEYNYALQDLLGVRADFANRLPPETASEDGFKNSSDMLQMSAMQFQSYREIALKALRRATVRGDRPEPVVYIANMSTLMDKLAASKRAKSFDANDAEDRNRYRSHFLDIKTGKAVQSQNCELVPIPDPVIEDAPPASPIVCVLPHSNELKIDLDRFLPDEGTMRVRIRAGRTTMKPSEYASLQLIFSAHTSNNANFSQVISEVDLPVTASIDEPGFIDFFIQLGDIQRNPFRKLETKFPRRDEFLTIRNVSNATDKNDPMNVHIDYLEISAPFFQQWPPKSHTSIFFDSDNRSKEKVYGREVLSRFLPRVYRRPVSEPELERFMKLFAEYRSGFSSFEDAMVEVLATALSAPEFLYVTQRSPDDDAKTEGTINQFELANRLAFFLWSSIPDEALLDLAGQGTLNRPDVLMSQVQRMLTDSRSERFAQHFVQQWLGMDAMGSVTHVSDQALKQSMQQEPIALFAEVLKQNGSVMDFLHSDYVVVNERLANHYGIRDVFGPHFRKVAVEPKAKRGGILTGAAVLAMNSDGKDSHPLKRGIWMLERILRDPPPPAPPNVPEVDLTDPRILEMTLKERIADHRNKPACVSCHAKIDPWGIAFENYDAMGSFRTKIGSEPVDATSALFNKQELAGMDGLKRYLLLERQDQFARAMVHKMTAYALGRPLSFADRADIDNLTLQFRKHDDRLGDLIQLIVNSRIFQAR